MQRENICDSLAFVYIVGLCLFLYCRFFLFHIIDIAVMI